MNTEERLLAANNRLHAENDELRDRLASERARADRNFDENEKLRALCREAAADIRLFGRNGCSPISELADMATSLELAMGKHEGAGV